MANSASALDRARVAEIEAPIRDPEIVAHIKAAAERAAALRDDIAKCEAAGEGNRSAARKAKVLRKELRAVEASMDNARRIELRRDAMMGEARDVLIRAKMLGRSVVVREVETAEVARDEHGARIIERRGPNRGLPALKYDRSTRVKLMSGIELAYRSGHLGDPNVAGAADKLLETGRAYAKNFALSNPLKAVDPSQVGGGGFGPRGPQMAAVEAATWLSNARAGLTKKQRAILDLVCGSDESLWGASQKLRMGLPAARKALREGLAVAARNQR